MSNPIYTVSRAKWREQRLTAVPVYCEDVHEDALDQTTVPLDEVVEIIAAAAWVDEASDGDPWSPYEKALYVRKDAAADLETAREGSIVAALYTDRLG